jgi:hypothetical protein
MDLRRIRPTDYGVLGVFILVLIGVSVGWYGVSFLSLIGWGTGFGAVAFVFALAALVFVCLKAFSPLRSGLAQWPHDGLVVLILGVLVLLLSVLGLAIRTEDWQGAPVQAGGILTLVGGLLLAGCGALAKWAGGLASAKPPHAPEPGYGDANANRGWEQYPQQRSAPQWQQPGYAPPQAPQWQPSYAPRPPAPAQPGAPSDGVLDITLGDPEEGSLAAPSGTMFCTACGASLAHGQAFCGKCGNRRG